MHNFLKLDILIKLKRHSKDGGSAKSEVHLFLETRIIEKVPLKTKLVSKATIHEDAEMLACRFGL